MRILLMTMLLTCACGKAAPAPDAHAIDELPSAPTATDAPSDSTATAYDVTPATP